MEDFDFYFDDEYIHPRQDSFAVGSISPLVLPLANTIEDVYVDGNHQTYRGLNIYTRKQSNEEEAAHWEALWQLEEDMAQAGPSYSSRYRQASQISVFDDDVVMVNLMENYDGPGSLSSPPPLVHSLSSSSKPSPFHKGESMQPRGWRLASPSSVQDSYSVQGSPHLRPSTMARQGSQPIDIPRKSPFIKRDGAGFNRPYLNYNEEQSTMDVDSPILRPASPPQKASSRATNPFLSVEEQISMFPQYDAENGQRHAYSNDLPSSDTLPVTLRKGLRLGKDKRSDSDISELDLGSALVDSSHGVNRCNKAEYQVVVEDQHYSPSFPPANSGNPYNLPLSSSLSVTPLLLKRNQSDSDANNSITSLPSVETAIFPLEDDYI